MKKTKILLFFILIFSLSSIFIACDKDKGASSVDFSYSQDSTNPKLYYFKASGHSDYGTFNYSWDFGNSKTASGDYQTHEFSNYGTHTVMLKADIDASGVHTSVSKTIKIDVPKIKNVKMEYNSSNNNAKEYYFKASGETDYGELEYEWDFGNNAGDKGEKVTKEFSDYGFKKVILTAKIKNLGNGIDPVSTSEEFEILEPQFKDLDFTYTTNSDDGRIIYFKANSKVTYGTVTYRWDFGNNKTYSGEEVAIQFEKYGKQTIQLTGTIKETGLTTTRTTTIDIEKPVYASFIVTNEVSNKDPLTVYFTANVESEGDLEYLWDFGRLTTYKGKQISHTFDSFGEKTVSVTVTNNTLNLEGTKTFTIELVSPLIQNLKYTYKRDKTDPLKMYYTASADSNYDLTYEWDFGDGNVKTGRTVEMNYTGFGLKNIVLKATAKSIGINTKLEDTLYFEKPTITQLDFEYVFDENNNYKAYFTTSGNVDYGELEYEWDFGFGNKYKGTSLNHTFSYYDDYPVYLTATVKGTNISKMVGHTVEVKEPAFDNFDFTYEIDEKNPLLVYFTGSGSFKQGELSYSWDFGRGNTNFGKTSNFQFDSYGEKTVSFTAKNTSKNVTDTITKKIILTSPQLNNLAFTGTVNKYEPLKYTFTASSESTIQDAQNKIVYEWDFGNGITKTGKTVDVTFDDFSAVNVILKAGISNIKINALIEKEFTPIKPQIGRVNIIVKDSANKKNKLQIPFEASAELTSGVGDIEYEWEFPGNVMYEGKMISHTFPYYDTFNVILTAKVKGTNITQKTTKSVTITGETNLNFDYSYIDGNDTDDFIKVTFLPSINDEFTGVSYEWDFGDKYAGAALNKSSEVSPTHKFTNNGTYKVKLCALANQLVNKQCITKEISINKPKLGLGTVNIIVKDSANIKNKLQIPFEASAKLTGGVGDIEYEWEFPGNVIYEGQKISHTFPYYGTFNVILTAKVKGTNITQKAYKSITITGETNLNFDYSYIDDNTTDEDFLKATFLPSINDEFTGVSYEWDFGDKDAGVALNKSSELSPTHKYTYNGAYVVKLCVLADQLVNKQCIAKEISIIERPYVYMHHSCSKANVKGDRDRSVKYDSTFHRTLAEKLNVFATFDYWKSSDNHINKQFSNSNKSSSEWIDFESGPVWQYLYNWKNSKPTVYYTSRFCLKDTPTGCKSDSSTFCIKDLASECKSTTGEFVYYSTSDYSDFYY